jgi:hypothetical protein
MGLSHSEIIDQTYPIVSLNIPLNVAGFPVDFKEMIITACRLAAFVYALKSSIIPIRSGAA